jgi:phytoene synthase
MTTTWTVEAAYARCEEITTAEAKNFAYGIKLLPPPKRRAMSAIYALARRIDDIGDGEAPVDEKLAGLAAVRDSLESVDAGNPPADDPVLIALADALLNFDIPLAAFGEVVEGCELDCMGEAYQTFDDLAVYCRLVAGSIGRLSLGVFGTDRPAIAAPLADRLGIALQVTNILRDIVEDREQMGRVYLPAQDLARFGCRPDASGPAEAMADLVRYEAQLAKGLYEEGLELLPLLDRRSRACVSAMAGIYRRLLDRIEAEPTAVLSRRISLPTWQKAWVAARALAGVAA